MEWFISFIFLLTFTRSYSLQCLLSTNGEPLKISYNDFDLDNLIYNLHYLQTFKYDDYDDACRIKFSIFHANETFIIEFTKHLLESELEEDHVRIDVIFLGNKQSELDIIHSIEYTCSFDDCELDFVRSFGEIFSLFNYTNDLYLSNELKSYIFGDKDEADVKECYLDVDDIVDCTDGYCMTRFEGVDLRFPTIITNCISIDEVDQIGISFQMIIDINSENEIIRNFNLICIYDNCNNYSIADNAWKLFDKHYSSEQILKIFNYQFKNSEEETTAINIEESTNSPTVREVKYSTTTSSMKTKSVTTSQPNSGLNHRIDSSIIFLLLIIFI